jgi:CubicO group peptidase (beta-lactamase class C family)
MPTPSLQHITRTVQADIDAGRLPGVVMVLHHKGRTVLNQALGLRDPAAHEPMRTDSIFRIYSMTKPIVSVALMMLVEEGAVELSDPVARHLPEFANLSLGIEALNAAGHKVLQRQPLTEVSAEAPTVLDLLRHTSGLTYGSFGDSLLKTEYIQAGIESHRLSNTELSQRLTTLPLAYAPGTVWEYSRATDVLGALIERVSGHSLGNFLQARILGPLGMVDTGFSVPPAQQARIAQPFAIDPDSQQAVKLLNPTRVPVFESGGGGLMSTAGDYLRFTRMLLAGGTLDGTRIVSAATVSLMIRDHLGTEIIRASRLLSANTQANTEYSPGPGYGFGLGFAVRVNDSEATIPGSPGDYYWGGLGGTHFWNDPQENLSAIWMMQAPYQREHYRSWFKNIVYAAL